MATIKRFEDLYSWQKARELTKFIYFLARKPKFSKDYGLKNQIERAAVSIMANQAEGFSRGTKTELINYFYIAKGSAGEVQSHLYVAMDLGYIDISEFRKAYQLADEAQKLIQSFADRAKAGGRAGIQYKQVKEIDPIREEFRKQGMVFTIEGPMKKEEAIKRGLSFDEP